MMSFPIPGWTLSLDFNMSRKLLSLLDELDQVVADCGGRVYLAKDARLNPEMFRKMYPDYHEWLKIKHEVDPQNRFVSDLSRRLKLFEE